MGASAAINHIMTRENAYESMYASLYSLTKGELLSSCSDHHVNQSS